MGTKDPVVSPSTKPLSLYVRWKATKQADSRGRKGAQVRFGMCQTESNLEKQHCFVRYEAYFLSKFARGVSGGMALIDSS